MKAANHSVPKGRRRRSHRTAFCWWLNVLIAAQQYAVSLSTLNEVASINGRHQTVMNLYATGWDRQ
jgi:hypothetical protein